MAAMVKRDRNHPSVVIWSYCNENGCGPTGGSAFRNATYRYDDSRPTLGNSWNNGGTSGSSSLNPKFTDVAGFSHVSAQVFDNFHQKHPDRPMMASECCSCNPSRVLRSGDSRHSSSGVWCAASQTETSDGRDFVSGSMVWTGFDCERNGLGFVHALRSS